MSFVGLISIESIVVGAPDSRAKSLGSTPDQVIVTVHPLHPFLKRVTKRICFFTFSVGDHHFCSRDLNVWFKGDVESREILDARRLGGLYRWLPSTKSNVIIRSLGEVDYLEGFTRIHSKNKQTVWSARKLGWLSLDWYWFFVRLVTEEGCARVFWLSALSFGAKKH